MKVGAVALACVLCLAVPAQAEEAARLSQPVTRQLLAQQPLAQQPLAQQPLAQQPLAQRPSPAEPPPAIRPWVDPSSAQQVGKIQPPSQVPGPVPAKTQPAPAPPVRNAQRQQRQCLNAVETRQTVAAHRLAEPVRALRAGRAEGEALRAKLCKWKQDQFVYEVFVLRRDGRIVRLYMNAQNGQSVGALDDDRH